MSRKVNYSLLAAAVALSAASQVQAAFVYDLRFAPGQTANGVQADNHTANITGVAAGTTYTLQLWGQISGDTDPTNESWGNGYLALTSLQGAAGGAIATGGLTTGVQGSNVSGGVNGTGPVDLNADSINDWGSTTSSTATNWLHWFNSTPQNSGNAFGFPGGTATTGSQAVNASTWEVLVATFTATVTTKSAQGGSVKTTSFNVVAPNAILTSTITHATTPGLVYFQDGLDAAHKVNGTAATTFNSLSFTLDSSGAVVTNAILAAAGTGTNLGTVNVVAGGTGGLYGVPVDLNANPAASGNVGIAGLGDGSVDVLLKVNKTAAQLIAGGVDFGGGAVTDFPGDVVYPWANVKIHYTGTTDAGNAFFNFDLSSIGGLVSEISAVPEPASLGLLAIGALSLVRRRRRN